MYHQLPSRYSQHPIRECHCQPKRYTQKKRKLVSDEAESDFFMLRHTFVAGNSTFEALKQNFCRQSISKYKEQSASKFRINRELKGSLRISTETIEPGFSPLSKKSHQLKVRPVCMASESSDELVQLHNALNLEDVDKSKKGATLMVVGKTLQESYAVEMLVRDAALKLPDGVRLYFGGESVKGASTESQFKSSNYFQKLESKLAGNILLLAAKLPSTHTLLSQNFKSFPVGTTAIADIQDQGKGRGGNKWESPTGCLMFSFTVEETNGRTLPFLQYVISLAVVQAIEVVSFNKGLKRPLEVRIKWPNDLYAPNGLKIGGVLCTSTYSDKKFNVVIGCGLNLSNEKPTTSLNALLQDALDAAEPITREELLAAIMNRFEELHGLFSKSGFHELYEPYIRCWLHSDQQVTLEEQDADDTKARRHVQMTIKGLASSGYLLAVDDNGNSFELHPDGNSFDFFKGLVRRKAFQD